MSKPVSISTSGVSVSSVVGLCHYIAPFSVSVLTTVTGTVTYSLEYVAAAVLVAYVLGASCGNCGLRQKCFKLMRLSCLLVLIGLSTWTWSQLMSPLHFG